MSNNIKLKDLINLLIDLEQSGEGEAVMGELPVLAIWPDAAVKVASGIAPRKAEALPDNGMVAAPVDFKEVAKAVLAKKEAGVKPLPPEVLAHLPKYVSPVLAKKTEPVKPLSLKGTALAMYQAVLSTPGLADKQVHAAQLVLFKKSKKKSWADLGLDVDAVEAIEAIAKPALPQKGAIFTNEATIAKAEKKAAPKSKRAENIASAKGSVEAQKLKPPRVGNGVETGLGTPKQRIRKLLDGGVTSVGAAQAIVALKKSAKKSWTALAVTDWEVEQITKLAGK